MRQCHHNLRVAMPLTPSLSASILCMQDGQTALHRAATVRQNHLETATLLLQHKASMDIQNVVMCGSVGARSLRVGLHVGHWVRIQIGELGLGSTVGSR